MPPPEWLNVGGSEMGEIVPFPFSPSDLWEESQRSQDPKIFWDKEFQRWKEAWEWNTRLWKERLGALQRQLDEKESDYRKRRAVFEQEMELISRQKEQAMTTENDRLTDRLRRMEAEHQTVLEEVHALKRRVLEEEEQTRQGERAWREKVATLEHAQESWSRRNQGIQEEVEGLRNTAAVLKAQLVERERLIEQGAQAVRRDEGAFSTSLGMVREECLALQAQLKERESRYQEALQQAIRANLERELSIEHAAKEREQWTEKIGALEMENKGLILEAKRLTGEMPEGENQSNALERADQTLLEEFRMAQQKIEERLALLQDAWQKDREQPESVATPMEKADHEKLYEDQIATLRQELEVMGKAKRQLQEQFDVLHEIHKKSPSPKPKDPLRQFGL